jgi:gliding motility-associated lipoprotein GldB
MPLPSGLGIRKDTIMSFSANQPNTMNKTIAKLGLTVLALCCLIACDKRSKVEREISEKPLTIKVERFDKAFFETAPQDLPALKLKYPYFFPAGNDDAIWQDKMQNPMWRELYSEVQKKFGNFQKEETEITDLVKHIQHYFPETPTPKVITVISEMDYHNKVIYADSLLLISLELYLGKTHRFYEFPKYISHNFEPQQMVPDVVSAFAFRKIPPPRDPSFLSQMIYAGKELYLKDLFLPKATDDVKMGYSPEQISWCQENESYIWRYYVDKKMLFSTDQKLASRFINPAPFSKFYLEIDNESPGRVGAWMGWQIVRAYMQNNKVSVQELLTTDAKELFEKSRYKPKK